MSFFEDYVQDGACCAECGVFIGDDVGFIRYCSSCAAPTQKTATQKRNARARRTKKRKQEEVRNANCT